MGSIIESEPLLTFEQFEQMPEQPGKQELLRGELVELPPAELKHHDIAHRIWKALDTALSAAHARREATQLGQVYHETGYKLGSHSWVVPDVSITHDGQPRGRYLGNAPPVAIEVISPGNRAPDVDYKTELYFEFGAMEVWRIYPKTRRAVITAGTAANIRVENERISTPLLPGFSLVLAEILGD
jgi:Uma2 family endonuclease